LRRAWIPVAGVAGAILLVLGGSCVLGSYRAGSDADQRGASHGCPGSRENRELEAVYQREHVYNVYPRGSINRAEPAGAWCGRLARLRSA